MPSKKEYLIELFLKFSKHYFAAKFNLEASERVLRGSYPTISDEEFERVMSEHGIDEYVEKITPILDSMFYLEEIEELNAFFTSSIGKKLTDRDYLLKIPVIIGDIFAERDSALAKIEKE